ncbi:MAG TPA: RICIN domain-containing protein [Candidatus Limnocylindrales bacterium]|nr:RICIN domain-containing protein [Candidatus Limnocylindrales bacterium]
MSKHRSLAISAGLAALLVVLTAGWVLRGVLNSSAAAAGAGTLAATAGCGQAPTLTSGTRSIQSSGQNRSYILRVPDNYDRNRPYRLVFAFHWLNGTANDVATGGADGAAFAYYGLQQRSNNSTIFVAPQGISNGWANTNGRDLILVDDLTNLIGNGLCVDTTLRFALGWSFGGAMSYAVACARPTVFRAVAVLSGANLSGCSGGTQPVAYLGIHGTHDSVLNISNGRTLRDTFVRNNGCTNQNPAEPGLGSLTHIVTAYSGCRAGFPVRWAAFDGDHTPSPVDGSTSSSGTRTWTSGEIWTFFSQFQNTSPSPTTGPTTPPPSSPPAGGQQIVGTGSGRCVDITGQATADGTRLQLFDCHSNWNQRWRYTNNTLVNPQSGKCVNANGGGAANGTAVNLLTCNGSGAQRWTVQANGNIVNTQSGRCLDAVGRGTANGTQLQIYDCVSGGQSNQQWTLR